MSKEATTYNLFGYSHAQVVNDVLRDAFTLSLFGLVLSTNVMIIAFPLLMQSMEIRVVRDLFAMNIASLVPGYALLFWMLFSPFIKRQKEKAEGSIPHLPKYYHVLFGIRCVLFASLLCSTFILRKQLNHFDHPLHERFTERVISGKQDTDEPVHSILPLLREYISM